MNMDTEKETKTQTMDAGVLADKMPLLSVIVPFRNAEKTLPRCLRALAAQTWTNLEVLLVDDGSTDGGADLCRRQAAADARFRLLTARQPGNVARARNQAMDAAAGEYLLFADADDLVCPQYAARLYDVLQEGRRMAPGIRVACCMAEDTFENGQEEYRCEDHAETVLMDIDDYSFLNRRSHRVVWGAIYDRRCVADLRFDDSFCCSTDTLFFARLLRQERRYAHTDERLYCYLLQDASVSKGRYDRRRFDNVRVWQQVAGMYEQEPAKVRRSAAAWPVLAAMDAAAQMIREGTRDSRLQEDLADVYRFRFAALWHSPRRRSLKCWLAAVSPSLYRFAAGIQAKRKGRAVTPPREAADRPVSRKED